MKIFNIKQANIFMNNGCIAVGCGLGDKGKVFIVFREDDTFEAMLSKWHNKEFN